ncbi:MFS transporter [Propionibacterium acidifaciens]|uniref:MFS transporter n=1 Tax=Propionibacterium acidifaciens TaxID=556499 RepID=UPI00366E9E4F
MSTTHCERNIPAEEPRAGTVLTTALGGRRRWAVLLVLLFAQFVLAIDLTIMDIALPGISTQLHPSSEQQLWIVDVYSLVLAGLLVAASSLSDRIGRKRTFLSGALVFCVGSALVLAARSAPGVIGVRAVMGFAAALIMPTTISAVRNIFLDAAERAVAVAAWSIVGGAGMAVGPVLGGFLVERFSWHSAFLVNIPLMGLVLVAGIAVLPEIKVVKKGPWDPAAAVLSLLGMVLTVWALKHIAAGDEAPAPRLLLTLALALSAGIALLALFVRRCLRAAEPLLKVRLFADRTFTGGILAAFGSMFALASMLFLLSQWMQLVNGYSPLRSGVLLLPAVLSGILSGATAPALARLLGPGGSWPAASPSRGWPCCCCSCCGAPWAIRSSRSSWPWSAWAWARWRSDRPRSWEPPRPRRPPAGRLSRRSPTISAMCWGWRSSARSPRSPTASAWTPTPWPRPGWTPGSPHRPRGPTRPRSRSPVSTASTSWRAGPPPPSTARSC